MRAYLNLRYMADRRAQLFTRGLRALGFEVVAGLPTDPRQGDVLITWNRMRSTERAARQFKALGLPVLVAENAAFGNDFAGRDWYTIARNYHNTAGCFDYHGPERWDSLAVPLSPFRTTGETVIVAQRGIGSPPTRMPKTWPVIMQKKLGARVRKHPGTNRRGVPLEHDLRDCRTVVTWGSGGAIKALMWGCSVLSSMPGWIGEQDNTEAGRLEMLRRLVWAQWTLPEIESGEAFARLLDRA
jgi:hypothetical protein